MDCESAKAYTSWRVFLRQLGVTLVELMIVIAIMGILTALGVPTYRQYMSDQCVEQVRQDFMEINLRMERYRNQRYDYPADLAELGMDSLTDCWDQPYRYLKLAGKKGKGGNRKDRSENPLNTDYDLYSVGADGRTNQSLRPKVSHDDIIRARDGAYIGLAADY